MDELIQIFIDKGGRDLIITKNKLAHLLYMSMTKDSFTRLEELGFVFVKTKRKVIEKYNTEITYKKYLWGMIKIPVDKKTFPVYKDIEDIVMRAKPLKGRTW